MRLVDARIHTLDPRRPEATSLETDGARLVGCDADAGCSLDAPGVELGGRCVLPGFSDAHVHFATWALARGQVRLEGVASLEEAVRRVAEVAASTPAGHWVRGLGWRDAGWDRPPTREALDAVCGDRPVALMAKDYHSLWLNSEGLARADGDLQSAGGVVELGADGLPSGILREEAAWRFQHRWLAPTRPELELAMSAALPVAAARGVTAIHDKDGGLGILPVWQTLLARGELGLRVWQSLPHTSVDELESLGVRGGFGPERLRIGYLKVFMDGTLGSGTARMLDGTGVEITSCEAFCAIIRRAARAGFAVAVHAIGDRANREALDAFERTRDAWAPLGLRPRIEHAQILDRAELPRFAALGVTGSVQFSHAPSDRDLADAEWGDRAELAYAWRSLQEAGARLANGSDAPVEELDPLAGLRAGVTRTTGDRPAWRAEQALDLRSVLEATCVAPAWLAHEEHRRGRLAPGFDADLVVLSRDPFGCPPDELDSIAVEATMVGGEWTWVDPAGPVAASIA